MQMIVGNYQAKGAKAPQKYYYFSWVSKEFPENLSAKARQGKAFRLYRPASEL